MMYYWDQGLPFPAHQATLFQQHLLISLHSQWFTWGPAQLSMIRNITPETAWGKSQN